MDSILLLRKSRAAGRLRPAVIFSIAQSRAHFRDFVTMAGFFQAMLPPALCCAFVRILSGFARRVNRPPRAAAQLRLFSVQNGILH
ncbi:MAG: hypothetical protein ACLTU3_11450 [Acutalibacteraceae bacterium]